MQRKTRFSLKRSARGLAVFVGSMFAAMAQAHAEGASASPNAAVPAPHPVAEMQAEKYFPGKNSDAPPQRIFRLTREQIDATVRAVLPQYWTQPIKTVMARDPLQTNYEYADLLSVNSANFGALTSWIGAIAARVRKNPAGVITCAGGNSRPAECLEQQARSFAFRAFRGDVSDERLGAITAFYASRVKDAGFEQATGDLVEVVLNSPHFLYRNDLDSERTRSKARLLQSLTYTFTDAPPSALNFKPEQAAAYFRSRQDAAVTLDAVLTAPAARDKLKRFFIAWLEIKDPADFTISPNYYSDFNPALAGAMVDEADRFLTEQLSTSAPKLRDITQTQILPQSKNLGAIYGTPASDPIAAKLAETEPSQRMGIFSLPAILASHSGPTNTRPIKRGVFWAKKVMCMDMKVPPKDLHIDVYDLPGATERQKIEQSTSRAACIGCHKVINPLGFFQENYDAIGKWRTTDNGRPIDASALIDFLGEGPPRKTETPLEAMKLLTGSSMFRQCFVRQLFRFYMGRNEEASDDPVLRQMFVRFSRDQDILKTVNVLTASDRILRP